MKKYFSLIRCGFLEAMVYRNNYIVSMLANFLQVLVLYYVWKSVFHCQHVVNGYTWNHMKQYVFISFLCNCTFSFGFEMHTAGRIIKGDIILDLLKPIGYREMLFFRLLGTAGMEFLITFVVTAIMFVIVNGLEAIPLLRVFIMIISLLVGQGIKFQIQYLFSMLCFYTDNAYGVVMAREILTNFFSGSIIPLVMFPPLLKNIADMLPFSGIVFIPCSIFMGTYTINETIIAIVFQIFWCVFLFFIGNIVWKKASAVIVIYGG